MGATEKERQAFDTFANRLKEQAQREGKYRTDGDIRKECQKIAERVEAKEREKARK